MSSIKCPNLVCAKDPSQDGNVLRRGFYRRKDDGQNVQRFHCKSCRKSFSVATFDPCYRQHKRTINAPLRFVLCSKFSQRRAAFFLNIDTKTVAKRVRFFGMLGRQHLLHLTRTVRGLTHAMFDEMQSSEHTKCKPISIPMVTCPKTRFILAVGVASMPAQYPLVQIAKRKYGPRPDDRAPAIIEVLEAVRPMLRSGAVLATDQAPRYPAPIAMVLPHVIHDRYLSRKPTSNGQGELKRIGFDPLFNFNHTAAMVRDGLGCLVRKTWGNTKLRDRLYDRLAMYAHFHNTILIPHLENRTS